MLVLQIIIKQWDKSQLTADHVLERANSPGQYPILFPPAFYVANKQIVIDQHDGALQNKRIKWGLPTDEKIIFDRFELGMDSKKLTYFNNPKTANLLGSLNQQFIKCTYTDRQSIFEGGFYYWLFEEVTVNAICIDEFDENIFIKTKPAIVFKDTNNIKINI